MYNFNYLIFIWFIILYPKYNSNQHKGHLFERQNQNQTESTKSISEHLGSDLNLVVSMRDGLANSFYLQDDFYSDNTKKLVEEKYNQFTPVINRLFVLDNRFKIPGSL